MQKDSCVVGEPLLIGMDYNLNCDTFKIGSIFVHVWLSEENNDKHVENKEKFDCTVDIDLDTNKLSTLVILLSYG